MAYLLGSKSCLDSLKIDIEDLENVIHDILNKTGSLKCHSWKFPDKLATDVEITDLLKRYQYRTNELDNQVSHVVLFELIIDRLLLILHGSYRFLEDIQSKLLSNSFEIDSSSSLSIGLVTKKYWNKFIELSTLLQTRKIRSIENEKIFKRSKTSLTSDKHCQTIETSFSPCTSCSYLQQYFRDYSNCIINQCNLYNLPSSLAYHRCLTSIIPEWLSYDDITQWSDCQTKDFDRLAKHLEFLNSTLNDTKTSLNQNETQLKKQIEINEQLKKSHNEEKQLFEKKFIEIKKQNDQTEFKLHEQIRSLTVEKEYFEQQLKDIRDECQIKTERLQKLEPARVELKTLAEQRSKSDELIKNLEQIRIRLETELEIVKRDLDERNRDLKKERLRIENMIRQEENTQSKQKTLSKTHGDLSQEYQSLKKEMQKIQFDRDRLQNLNEQISEELASLKSNNQELYQRINEQQSHRTLNKSSQTTAPIDCHIQNTENQLRLTVLQRENEALKLSLEQNLHSTRHEPQPYVPISTPLFMLNTEILERQQQQQTPVESRAGFIPRFSENDYAANGWIRPESAAAATVISQPRISRRNLSSARPTRRSTNE